MLPRPRWPARSLRAASPAPGFGPLTEVASPLGLGLGCELGSEVGGLRLGGREVGSCGVGVWERISLSGDARELGHDAANRHKFGGGSRNRIVCESHLHAMLESKPVVPLKAAAWIYVPFRLLCSLWWEACIILGFLPTYNLSKTDNYYAITMPYTRTETLKRPLILSKPNVHSG